MYLPAAPASGSKPADAAHRKDAHRAIARSAIGLALTGGVELLLAGITHSVGLLGDAIHNLSDVSTSAAVLLGFLISKKEATRRYPYGYERAEDLAGLAVALVIWASAAFAGIESYRKLVGHGTTNHLALGMIGAIIGILGNQAVAVYKRRVGSRIHSTTLLADAKHSWLDAISSLGALVGLIAVWLGHPLGDPIAGFFITLFILHVGYEVTKDVLHHLMDGIEPEYLDRARAAANSIIEIDDLSVKGRWIGRSLLLELEPSLPGKVSMEEASITAARIESAVRAAIDEVAAVTVRPRVRR
jgi:cation diffusion facilitator family transporter